MYPLFVLLLHYGLTKQKFDKKAERNKNLDKENRKRQNLTKKHLYLRVKNLTNKILKIWKKTERNKDCSKISNFAR